MDLQFYDCVLCDADVEESLVHLFLFATECWNLVYRLTLPYHHTHTNPYIFMEIVILLCWSIWIVRNDAVLQGVAPLVARVKGIFLQKFALMFHRTKKNYSPQH